MIRNLVLTALASLGTLAAPAMAQSNSMPGGDQQYRVMMPNFDIATITPVFQMMGAQTQPISMSGNPAVGVIHSSGARFIAVPRACDDSGRNCAGLGLVAAFNESATADQANAFNTQSVVGSVAVANGLTLMTDYLIADFGTPRGNLIITSNVFVGDVVKFIQYNNQIRNAVSFEPLVASEDKPVTSAHDLADLIGTTGFPGEFVMSDNDEVVGGDMMNRN